jgi:serpin B
LVLANAIYFKGTWVKRFEKAGTSMEPFHATATRKTNVPLMHHWDDLDYMENKDYQAVELPYSGPFSMLVVLPRRVDGCGALENQLTPELLLGLLGQMERRNIELFLPRFKLESDLRLNDTLAKMGMPDVFGTNTDFSGIDGITNLLYISGIFHKAWGEVNEEGTEAIAATVDVETTRGVHREPLPTVVFRADHPFIFFIRDVGSRSILFLGRLAEPMPVKD